MEESDLYKKIIIKNEEITPKNMLKLLILFKNKSNNNKLTYNKKIRLIKLLKKKDYYYQRYLNQSKK